MHIDTPLLSKGLNTEYTFNESFKSDLTKLHKMSDNTRTDPMVASQADNSKTAADILAFKIAEQCAALSTETDQKRKIQEVVKDALIQFGQDEESVKNIIAQFNPEMSVAEYRSTYINSHLIQAMALIDSTVFHSFKSESLLPLNRNKKFHTMQLSPQFFTLALKKYMAMFDDTGRERYLQNVRIFSERISRFHLNKSSTKNWVMTDAEP